MKNQVFPKCIKTLDYPDPESRKDLWATTQASLGLREEYRNYVFLLYWKGKPRILVTQHVPREATIAYASGPAFSVAPPLLIACDGDAILETLALIGGSYEPISTPLSWNELERMPAGQISPAQAEAVIAEITKENRRWFEDERSQRVVGALPRIFPEGTLILYELLQNATDSGATHTAFRLDNDTLVFLHNGDPFTENDVSAISFVNWSFKPPETIGFMGLGFKAAYEVSTRPEIHSPPYFFFFDGEQDGGSLFPTPLPVDTWQHIPDGFTTLFRLPLKATAVASIKRELERFDGRLLLYIGRQLCEVETPRARFSLRTLTATDNIQHVALGDSLSGNPRNFVVFRQPFTPSEEAVAEFARSRNANPDSYRQRTQQVSIAVELRDGNVVTDSEGHLQVYLPTGIGLPFAFDVQGNFIIDASRQQLRNATGSWNSEHFAQLGELLITVLRHAKDLALAGDPRWASFYDLLPLWSEIRDRFPFLNPENTEGTNRSTARAIFNQRLLDDGLIPVADEHGNLAFVSPNQATYIEPDLEAIIEPRDSVALANIKPLWSGLSEKAKSALCPYVGRFGPVELAKHLREPDWENKVLAFNEGLETPTARQLLIHILAYLHAHMVELILGLVDNGTCRVILTEDKHLHAKLEKGLPSIRSLPATEVDFPQEELRKRYELVHRTLLRDLRHPGESGLESAPAHDALAILTQLAPELTADVIAKEIIHPAFQETNWNDIPDDRLFRYTRFLLENSAKIAISSIQLKVRVSARIASDPMIQHPGKLCYRPGLRLPPDSNRHPFQRDAHAS